MSTDRNEIDCPRAKSWMTPCIGRDGHSALSDPTPDRPAAKPGPFGLVHPPATNPEPDGVCVGCGHSPVALLAELAGRYEPAQADRRRRGRGAADALQRHVGAYVNREPAMTTVLDPDDLPTPPPDADDVLSNAMRAVTADESEDSVSAFNSAL